MANAIYGLEKGDKITSKCLVFTKYFVLYPKQLKSSLVLFSSQLKITLFILDIMHNKLV